MTTRRRQVEWAVIQQVFRGIHVVKDGLASKEEATLWQEALWTTRKRENYEHFLRTDGHSSERPYDIAWRYVDVWRSPEEEPEP